MPMSEKKQARENPPTTAAPYSIRLPTLSYRLASSYKSASCTNSFDWTASIMDSKTSKVFNCISSAPPPKNDAAFTKTAFSPTFNKSPAPFSFEPCRILEISQQKDLRGGGGGVFIPSSMVVTTRPGMGFLGNRPPAAGSLGNRCRDPPTTAAPREGPCTVADDG